jgi:hypothetical protein
MKFDVTKPAESGSETEWIALPSNIYHMKCVGAKIAPSMYADEKTGEHREELTLVWECIDPLKHPESPSKEYKSRVYQRMAPFYGETARGPSKFKMYIDQLWSEKLIRQEFEVVEGETADNQGDLVGIERRVMVSNYPLTMGPNKGKPANKVLEILPLDPDTPLANAERPVASRPAPEPQEERAIYTEAEIRAMSADELCHIAKNLAEEAGGRFRKRLYDTMKHGALVDQVMELQEVLGEEVFSPPF